MDPPAVDREGEDLTVDVGGRSDTSQATRGEMALGESGDCSFGSVLTTDDATRPVTMATLPSWIPRGVSLVVYRLRTGVRR